MPNTGIAKVLTARKSQFKVLQYEMKLINLDITRANQANIYLKAEYP